MAIRWDNVSGPSVAQAAIPLGDAQKTVSGMFSGIDDILKKREAMETANWDQGKLNNTNAFLNAVQGAKTPEEYAAMEAGLREQFAGYGAQIDTAAGRNALDGRRAILQQRGLADQQYTDQKQEVTDRVPEAMFRTALMNAQSPEEAKNIQAAGQAAFGNNAFSPSAAMRIQQYALDREQNIVNQGRATTKFGFEEAAEKTRLANEPLQRQILQATLRDKQESTAASRATRLAANAEKTTTGAVHGFVNNYFNQNVQRTEAARTLAKEMNFPVDPKTGAVTPSVETGQTPEQVKQFQETLLKRIGPAITPSQVLDEVGRFAASSGLPVDRRNQLLKSVGESLTDVNMLAPSDRLKTEENEKKLKQARETIVKNNPWYGAEVDKASEVTRVLQKAGEIKDWTLRDVAGNFNEMMTKGFWHDGELKVIPPKVLEQAIALGGGIQKNTKMYNDTLANTEVALAKLLSDPKTAKLMEEAKNFDNSERVKKGEFVSSLNLPATARTNETNFDNYWKNQVDKAKSPK